jgi:hypothetical protein
MVYRPEFDPRTEPVAQLLKRLQTLPDLENFLVVPEGVMLNYQLRKPSSSKYINFMPPEIIIYGEENILQDLADHPPQYVVVIPKDTREYGVGEFGQDPRYGARIMSWIASRYEPVWQVPMGEDSHIRLLRRK